MDSVPFESDNCCPICLKQYNSRSRKQMMVCLNQHFICARCADQISENDSKCPFCQKQFNIAQIQPRRILGQRREEIDHKKYQFLRHKFKMGLCPSNHLVGRFEQQYKGCNKCGKNKMSQFLCYECKYSICGECKKCNHKELCQNQKFIYNQEYRACNLCCKNVLVGKICVSCNYRICPTCQQKQKQNEKV